MNALATAALTLLTLVACAQPGEPPGVDRMPGSVDSLAALISTESYCDDLLDMRRVATVVANRVADERFPDTYAGVIGDTVQFPSLLHPDYGTLCPGARDIARAVVEEQLRVLEPDVIYFYRPDHTGAAGDWLEFLRANTVVRGEHHHFAKG